MLKLVEINEENFFAFRALRVSEEQQRYLDSPLGILARGYVYRDCRARVFGIQEDGQAIGLALVRDLDQEPACYDLQQFLIDLRFQGKGRGALALSLILAQLERERKYDCVEVCVKRENTPALGLFAKLGFADSGYLDPDAPDCLNLTRAFPSRGDR